MHFTSTALFTAAMAFAAAVEATPEASKGSFKVTDFYAHHIPTSEASYVGFQVSVSGSAKNAATTYCSYYGGSTANDRLPPVGGTCLDPQVYWTFSGVSPKSQYTLTLYNRESKTSYDQGVFVFKAGDVGMYQTTPDKNGTYQSYAYIAKPKNFNVPF